MAIKVDDYKIGSTRGGKRYSHESYAMININRCTAGGLELFGSDIKHNTFFDLTIQGADQINDLGRSWFMPKDTKIKIRLSSSQFVEMIGSMNTSGVPCTLVGSETTGHINYEAPPSPLEYAEGYVDETVREAKVIDKKLVSRAKDILTSKGAIKKAEKDELLKLIQTLSTQVGSNLDFAAEQGKEAVERTKAQGMSEIDARVQHLITSTGIKVLQDENLMQKLLEEK